MLAFLIYSAVSGLFMSFIWQTNSAINVLIKMAFAIQTIVAIVLILQVIFPGALVPNTDIKLW